MEAAYSASRSAGHFGLPRNAAASPRWAPPRRIFCARSRAWSCVSAGLAACLSSPACMQSGDVRPYRIDQYRRESARQHPVSERSFTGHARRLERASGGVSEKGQHDRFRRNEGDGDGRTRPGAVGHHLPVGHEAAADHPGGHQRCRDERARIARRGRFPRTGNSHARHRRPPRSSRLR